MELLNLSSPAGAQGPIKLKLAFVVLLVWMGLMVFSAWHFQLQYSTAWVTFDGSQLEEKRLVGETGKLSVIHFVNPDCPCSRFSKPHIIKIEASIGSEKVSFNRVQAGEVDSLAPPASPSVAVWNEKGNLIYFGPYSSGEICGVGKDLLSQVLLRPELKGQLKNQEAIGCFCKWPTSQNSEHNFRKV